ncbi:MAG: hypothetical protein ACRYF5_16660 [Janthinobacterium lividum]
MKKIVMVFALMATASVFARSVHVAAHTTKNGTYVQSHERTAPDTTKANNYSTKGNVNPYTGKAGTVEPNK